MSDTRKAEGQTSFEKKVKRGPGNKMEACRANAGRSRNLADNPTFVWWIEVTFFMGAFPFFC